ncbi:MAG: Co2+/Mg2+ efflux protein ApaG [Gammaproteobacteria bacterium]|nr:Co2+/Mg2+ efflux protein ApaG [Gammaproteobacteria bacterium]NND38238.1 Co2+/Mg2+ efflux protein ApaG [Pseudomonadales bacterium]MBT8150337.1 Co2+/Mg2+ efflux protein ApaG [Gammaproteobacteria bacterium]NNL11312.1 Co2+/Mg2+ efflux protein ApaG [Pseudomonadales bacterium]NNM12030.1 Co2+/Mg2+ efflux protein ApaG [Pseudomonadales bacterium]
MEKERDKWQQCIGVNVEPRYLAEQSNPEDGEYVFAYTVEVSNRGSEPIQLLSRHWIITDGNNAVREVRGDGVVGEQPHIPPGKIFRYSSGAILGTRTGTMEGSYTMRSESGAVFDTFIHPFGLVHPGALN